MIEVTELDGVNKCFVCEIYGWASGPCIFFGDFNEILCTGEKLGGVARSDRDMQAFRDCVDDFGLKERGFRGSRFTWSR